VEHICIHAHSLIALAFTIRISENAIVGIETKNMRQLREKLSLAKLIVVLIHYLIARVLFLCIADLVED
jgi:aryl-alcohol dehydrogenase-like predicted oxidoreductase